MEFALEFERLLERVRSQVPKKQSESLGRWFRRTYSLALETWDAQKPPLPLKAAQMARSANLLKSAHVAVERSENKEEEDNE